MRSCRLMIQRPFELGIVNVFSMMLRVLDMAKRCLCLANYQIKVLRFWAKAGRMPPAKTIAIWPNSNKQDRYLNAVSMLNQLNVTSAYAWLASEHIYLSVGRSIMAVLNVSSG